MHYAFLNLGLPHLLVFDASTSTGCRVRSERWTLPGVLRFFDERVVQVELLTQRVGLATTEVSSHLAHRSGRENDDSTTTTQ